MEFFKEMCKCKKCEEWFESPRKHFYSDGIATREVSPCCYDEFEDFRKVEFTEKEKRITWILFWIALGGCVKWLFDFLF